MRISPIIRLLISVNLLLSSGWLYAEKSDREKPVNIESDRLTADDNKKISYFEGNVILDQGTIHLTADHMTVREDPEGMKYASAFGNPVTFRQKRDGLDEWVDGTAQHVEYNGKLEQVELFDHAAVHQGKDEIKGDYLSYDTKTELLHANGVAHNDQPHSMPGRVHVVLQPQKNEQKKGDASVTHPSRTDNHEHLLLKQDTELVP